MRVEIISVLLTRCNNKYVNNRVSISGPGLDSHCSLNDDYSLQKTARVFFEFLLSSSKCLKKITLKKLIFLLLKTKAILRISFKGRKDFKRNMRGYRLTL